MNTRFPHAPTVDSGYLKDLRERVQGTKDYHASVGIPPEQTEAGLNCVEALRLLDTCLGLLMNPGTAEAVLNERQKAANEIARVRDETAYDINRHNHGNACTCATCRAGRKKYPHLWRADEPMDAQSVPYEGDGLYAWHDGSLVRVLSHLR